MDDIDWSDTERLKADFYAVLCERNEMASEIKQLRDALKWLEAENATLRAALRRIDGLTDE